MISVAYAADASGNLPMYSTPEFWLCFTFVLLVLIAIKPFYRAFKIAMIVRGAKIKKQIVSAQVLRADTERLLQDYLKKQENVETEISEIVEKSKIQAEELRKEAEEKLKEQLVIKEKQVMDNIALMEKSALGEINSKITEITLNATQKILEEGLDADKDNRLVAAFVSDFPDTLKKMN